MPIMTLNPKIVAAIEYVLNKSYPTWTCKITNSGGTRFSTTIWVEFLDSKEIRRFLIEKDVRGDICVVTFTNEPCAICIHVVGLLQCPLFDKNDMRVKV